MRVDSDELAGLAEVAEMAGVPRPVLSQWRARKELDFPSPIAELRSGPVFRRRDILNWLEKGKVPMANLMATINPADLFTSQYAKRSEQVFMRPGCQYGWNEIVMGVDVQRENGSTVRMAAVAWNTFRGFHRISKDGAGAQTPFQRYFIAQRQTLVADLLAVADREALHRVSNRICTEIKRELTNIRADQLRSFNKVRKPVDLYLEHLVAMSFDLEKQREKLVPLLYLPLDCQILRCRELFTEEELAEHGLRRSSTYSAVKDEEAYLSLQEIVVRRAEERSREVGQPFWPIYFDLFWNNRHRNWGTNLFETNPNP